jgi:hypothetical protein
MRCGTKRRKNIGGKKKGDMPQAPENPGDFGRSFFNLYQMVVVVKQKMMDALADVWGSSSAPPL